MERTLTLSKESWIYKVAKFGGLDRWRSNSTDICSLLRALVVGMIFKPIFLAVLCALGLAAIFGVAVYPLIALYAYLFDGLAFEGEALIGPIMLLIGVIFLAAVGASQTEPVQRIAGAAYRGWKEKTCFIVDLK